MIGSNAQVCTVCVMDAADPNVSFDNMGQCDCCTEAFARRDHEWWPGLEGASRMQTLLTRLREEGSGKPYDAMIGLSGGIDSAFLAHVMGREHGLRLLAVHVDGGWNSEAAVSNIERLVRALDIDLHTKVIEWEEMRDLQLAFLRSGVFNQDFPQDHAFFATLVRTARKYRVRTFLSGVNYSSESVSTPTAPNPTAYDGRHLKTIHAKFGERPLTDYPIMTLPQYLWMTRILKSPVIEKPLNLIDYDKEKAKDVLRANYGWRDYGPKHSESRFTKFYQEIYLTRKYLLDKRRLHLSSLIVSGQISRDEALLKLTAPIAEPTQSERDLRFIAKKLRIARLELDQMIDDRPRPHAQYASDFALQQTLLNARALWRRRSGKTAA